jgi:purine-nucleoside phosphorylase
MSIPFDEFRKATQSLLPRSAVVLGSGLGQAAQFQESASIPFEQLPGIASPTVRGHAGRLAAGLWAGVPALVFFGRLHFYEGHTWNTVVAPIRLAAELGIRRLLLTNAAGGIHPALEPGRFMAIRGHIPLLEPHDWKRPEPRTPYSPRLLQILVNAGLREGLYAAVTGPCYETPAEIRALHEMGADAVGMSTAKEAEEAAHRGIEVVAISCITNRAAGLGSERLDHADVLANARTLADGLGDLIALLIGQPVA